MENQVKVEITWKTRNLCVTRMSPGKLLFSSTHFMTPAFFQRLERQAEATERRLGVNWIRLAPVRLLLRRYGVANDSSSRLPSSARRAKHPRVNLQHGPTLFQIPESARHPGSRGGCPTVR